jgi:hypothetical protein
MTKIHAVSPDNEPDENEPTNPFDPAVLATRGVADINVEKVLTAVPVRRPKPRQFVRVHPDYAVDTLVLERDSGMEKECYLVDPEVEHLVLPELRRTRLHVAVTKRGAVFIWPIKLPIEGSDTGRRVFQTAIQCAEQAKTLWIRMAWSNDLGGYEMHRAKGDLGDPQWPDKSFAELLEIAFRHYRIDRADHEVIRELEGEL